MLFGFIGSLPLHPLVVHATVMFIMLAALGAIVLAFRPSWRHKFGWLAVVTSWASVFAGWLAIESGNILTTVPGLGETVHAAGGTVLGWMLLPFAAIITLMILLDRRWHWNVNKHGDVWRSGDKQPKTLLFVCAMAVVMSLTVMGQTAIVGHSGAEASWGDISPSDVPAEVRK